jgi:hypothetical protein
VSDDDPGGPAVQAGDTDALSPSREVQAKVFRLAYQVLRDQEEALDPPRRPS